MRLQWHTDVDGRHPVFQKLRLYHLGMVYISPLRLQLGVVYVYSTIAEFDAYFWFNHLDGQWHSILAANLELHHILIPHLDKTRLFSNIRYLINAADRLWILILSILFLTLMTDAKMLNIISVFRLQFINSVSSFTQLDIFQKHQFVSFQFKLFCLECQC